MKNRYVLGAGLAVAMAFGGTQGHAQMNFFGPFPPGAFYLGPEGGWTHLTGQNPSVTVTGPNGYTVGARRNGNIRFDSGFNAGVRAGYLWGPWRFEGEYSYRFNGVSNRNTNFTFPAGTTGFAETGGSTHSNAIMANVIYDFTLGWPITPHIGAGSNNSWGFAYQAIAGLRYFINPALALDVDYRYLASTNNSFTGTRAVPGSDGVCCFTTNVGNVKYATQNVVASLTMMFGAPPAAPPPAPPAPPPPPTHQVYLVFFDWDRYNITPEGMQILEAAAAHWKAGGAVQIQVTGYTDLSGSAGYNQRLSERRANAVAVALQRLGIPRNEMIVAGRGMNDPRVPTALGVREPQNRRVEIVFP